MNNKFLNNEQDTGDIEKEIKIFLETYDNETRQLKTKQADFKNNFKATLSTKVRDIRSDQGPKGFRQSALLDQRCFGRGFSGLAGALAFRWWWLCPSFRARGVELLSSYKV